MKKLLLLFFALVLATIQTNATTYYSRVTTGNWDGASWSTSKTGGTVTTHIFTSSDDVVIQIGNTITVNVTATCKSLTVGAITGSGTAKLQFLNSGIILTVSGNVTLNDGGQRYGYLDMFNGGTLKILGDFIDTKVPSTQFTKGTGTVEYNGTAQTVLGTSYNILTFSASGTKTASGNISVTTLNNTSGVILDMGTNTLTVPGTIPNDGSTIRFNGASNGLAIPTGTVEYYGTTQTVATGTYSILTLSASGTKTAGGNLTASTLNNSNGSVLDMSGYTLAATTINNGSSTIRFNGTNGFVIPTGTVDFYGSTQTIPSGIYSTLTISASGTKTAGGNLTATTLNNLNGSILDMIGYTLFVSGTITNTASTIRFNSTNGFAISTGTVEYYGATQTLPAGNYNNLSISTNGTKTLAGATAVTGALTISSGATLDANSSTITITGAGLAWDNLGTFIYGSSSVIMQGTAAQSMHGSTFYNLEINNPSGVTLTTSDVVTNQLKLTSGRLILNGNKMTLNPGATLAGIGGNALSNFNNSNSNYIVTSLAGDYLYQHVASADVIYPVGTATSFTPAVLNNNLGTPDNYGVYVETATVHSLDIAGVVNKQWTIQEEVANNSNLIMTFQWNSPSDEGLGFTGATTAAIGIWGGVTGPNFDVVDSLLTITGANPRSVKMSKSQMMDFSGSNVRTYAIGRYNSVMPVELSSFTSAVNGRDVSLDWKTMTEKNSNKFEIERSVNQNWTSVGTVKAADLSNSPKQYSFTDKNLQAGKYQYRLKMIDNDGTFAYSKVTEAVVSTPKSFELSQNYPNPFNPSTRIGYQIPVDSKVTLEVYNIVGQRVAMIVNEEQSAGYYTVNFNSTSYRNITSGVYIYKLTAVDNAGKNSSSIKKMMLLK